MLSYLLCCKQSININNDVFSKHCESFFLAFQPALLKKLMMLISHQPNLKASFWSLANKSRIKWCGITQLTPERLHEALFHQKKKWGGGRRGRREGRMPLLHLKHSERWICCFSFSLLLTVNAYKGNFFSLRENILDLFFPKQFLTAAALFKREKTECHRLIKLFWWPPFTHSGPVLS